MYVPNYSAEFGCYWHLSDREGEENSVGGDGCRPVSNSVMYGEALALGKMAALLGNSSAQLEWEAQAEFWQEVILGKLWSDELEFFVTLTVPKPNDTASTSSAHSTHADVGATVARRPASAADSPPLAGSPGANCPSKGEPHWPTGKLVTVREIMGLSSPW